MTAIYLLLLAVVFALIPALVARHRGRRLWLWFLIGFVAAIPALIVVLVLGDKRPRCPQCREHIQTGAAVCPHCQSQLVTELAPA